MKLKIVRNGIEQIFKNTLKAEAMGDAWLQRVALPEYLNAQRERFRDRNAGDKFEGSEWSALNPEYARRKREKFASYPGKGRKINIATGRLMRSLLLENSDGRKMIRSGRMLISTLVPYAQYVDDSRTITKFSKLFTRSLAERYASYMVRQLSKTKGAIR